MFPRQTQPAFPALSDGQDGTNSTDQASGVVISPDDGSVVVVGRTYGDWEGTSAGEWDFAAFKLDSEGDLVWKWQVSLYCSVSIIAAKDRVAERRGLVSFRAHPTGLKSEPERRDGGYSCRRRA